MDLSPELLDQLPLVGGALAAVGVVGLLLVFSGRKKPPASSQTDEQFPYIPAENGDNADLPEETSDLPAPPPPRRVLEPADVDEDGEPVTLPGLPLLGVIPPQVLEVTADRADLLLHRQPLLSPVAEGYRRIWERLGVFEKASETAASGPVRVLAITGIAPGEGASTTVANLALSAARLGYSVLVVDADLRRPEQHRLLNALPLSEIPERAPGLTDLLGGSISLTPTDVARPTLMRNVRLIAAGSPATEADGGASRFATPQAARFLLSQAPALADIVLFDAPPALETDAPARAVLAQASGVILVVDGDRRETNRVRPALRALEREDSSTLGGIVVWPGEPLLEEEDEVGTVRTAFPPPPAVPSAPPEEVRPVPPLELEEEDPEPVAESSSPALLPEAEDDEEETEAFAAASQTSAPDQEVVLNTLAPEAPEDWQQPAPQEDWEQEAEETETPALAAPTVLLEPLEPIAAEPTPLLPDTAPEEVVAPVIEPTPPLAPPAPRPLFMSAPAGVSSLPRRRNTGGDNRVLDTIGEDQLVTIYDPTRRTPGAPGAPIPPVASTAAATADTTDTQDDQAGEVMDVSSATEARLAADPQTEAEADFLPILPEPVIPLPPIATASSDLAPAPVSSVPAVRRPEVMLEVLAAPDAGTTLRATTALPSAPVRAPRVLLEITTKPGEATSMRAGTPSNTPASAPANPNDPDVLLETTTRETAADAATMRIQVSEPPSEAGSSEVGTTLLEASLQRPEAMNIRSGAGQGDIGVRFEMNSEQNGGTRFRATVVGQADQPALLLEMERALIEEPLPDGTAGVPEKRWRNRVTLRSVERGQQ